MEVLGHEERFIVIFNDVDSRKVYPNVVAKWFGFEFLLLNANLGDLHNGGRS